MSLPDRHDPHLALTGDGLLAAFNQAGVLTAADVHVARTLGRLTGEADPRVLLAAGFAVAAVRDGAVCVDLHDVRRAAAATVADPSTLDTLPWPTLPDWYAATRRSPLVALGADGPAGRPVRLVGDLVYLDRYWQQEELVRTELAHRADRDPPPVDPHQLGVVLRRLFPSPRPDAQRLAAAAVATGWLTIIAGGPGTGKTKTIGDVLDLLEELGGPMRVALAAPTGKAAARLSEAVAGRGHGVPPATTLHRLLGWRPGSRSRFRYDRHHRLPFDVVVVDETSMVSLTLMARLLEALRPDARLVLVGDPDQLASVEAGAVLGDLVARPARPGPDARETLLDQLLPGELDVPDEKPTTGRQYSPRPAPTGGANTAAPHPVRAELRADVVRLRRPYRFATGSSIAELAAAVRRGDADTAVALLRAGGVGVEFADAGEVAGLRADVVASGQAMYDAAGRGDPVGALAALGTHRLLCAHRHGPAGVERWNAQIEQWLQQAYDSGADRSGFADRQSGGRPEWYVGRPLLVTANDYQAGLSNGDTGVVINRDGVLVAVFARGADLVTLPLSRLAHVQTAHAMTVHKSQGSQFEKVTVLLPDPTSPLLTRELLYTAITRASTAVRLIGSSEAVRRATLQPTLRASGLRQQR